MKIATWNINMGAAIPWRDNKTIRPDIIDSIMNVQADVFIITEVAVASGWDYFEEQMENNNYVWFFSFVSGKNGILIMVKKELIDDTEELAKNLWWKEETLHCYDDIGLLTVSFKMNNRNCTVCGFRMPIGNAKGKEQYDEMSELFCKKILPIVGKYKQENRLTIFAGDFNNARYLDDYTGRAQINYNWQFINSKFEKIGFEMLDVNENKGPIITKNNGKTGPVSPIDHIFTVGFSKNQCNIEPDNGLSDHLILWARIEESK